MVGALLLVIVIFSGIFTATLLHELGHVFAYLIFYGYHKNIKVFIGFEYDKDKDKKFVIKFRAFGISWFINPIPFSWFYGYALPGLEMNEISKTIAVYAAGPLVSILTAVSIQYYIHCINVEVPLFSYAGIVSGMAFLQFIFSILPARFFQSDNGTANDLAAIRRLWKYRKHPDLWKAAWFQNSNKPGMAQEIFKGYDYNSIKDIEILLWCFVTLVELKDDKLAEQVYVEYIQNSLSNFQNKIYLCYLRYSQYEYEQALDLVNEAINDPVEDLLYLAYYNRGICYLWLGCMRDAVRDFDRCLSLKSDFYEVPIYRCQAYICLGDMDAALEDVEIIEQSNDFTSNMVVGTYFLHLSDLVKAKELFAKSLELDPNSVRAQLMLDVVDILQDKTAESAV